MYLETLQRSAREKTVRAPVIGAGEDAIRSIAQGKIQVKKLISNHFGLTKFAAAYQYIDDNSSGSVMKVMITVKE
jgi:threonine dehydrogenase-like Zn-dependent dehydrogenase